MIPQTDPLIQRRQTTPELLQQLQEVNVLVNSEVSYVSDQDKYGTPEKWENAELEGNQGDCEDYVLAKRLRLRNLGWGLSSLDVVLCYDETQSYHCILVARLSDGDKLLDNRQYSIWDWNAPAEPMDKYKLSETTVGGTFLNWRPV